MNETSYELALRELSASEANIRPSDVVLFSEPVRAALNFVLRLEEFSLNDFAAKLGVSLQQAQEIADILVKRNLFQPLTERATPQETFYKARVSARANHRPSSDIWNKLG